MKTMRLGPNDVKGGPGSQTLARRFHLSQLTRWWLYAVVVVRREGLRSLPAVEPQDPCPGPADLGFRRTNTGPQRRD